MWAIVAKDLAIELRTRQGIASLVVLALLVLLVFRLALPEGAGSEGASAALWIAVLFAGTIGIQRSILRERDRLAIDGLLSAPIDPGAIFLAKTISNACLLSTLELLLLPLALLFFRIDPGGAWPLLVLVLVLGSVGFSALGTLLAAISVRTRAREVLLPILLFPLLVPILLSGVEATVALLSGTRGVTPWLEILLASDVAFVATGWLLFETVVRE